MRRNSPARGARVGRVGRLLGGVWAAAIVAAVASGCDDRAPKPETSATPSAQEAALPGVKPHDGTSMPASDRPGAVAIGAVEAGQSGGAGSGGATGATQPAAPTAGDGAASAAAASASR